MDKDRQLTFSDDPLLNRINQVFLLIEDGNFSKAVKSFDDLLSLDPDYPGVIEGYRTAKFWNNRQIELSEIPHGKKTADFLMKQWDIYEKYAVEKEIISSESYKSAMKFIFFKASENYRAAFQNQEDTANNFSLLINLGDCFLRLEEYKYTIDTLEYAKTSYQTNARLLSLLAEAYYQLGDTTKSLLFFKEAFFIDPTQIDLSLINAEPITKTIEIIKNHKKEIKDIREWIPVYATVADFWFVKKKINKYQISAIEKEAYNLEVSFQKMNKEQIEDENVLPRMINKYLWILDYYEFQDYNFKTLSQVRERLISLEPSLFMEFFKNASKRK